ncbi:DUF7659 family protein [Paenibacillus sp. Dod16]|uniref:DUF7659 family protein n=1 Tax=Paenibacillus sp. Dod16 TaxID=3416392 RepID=UPI003CECD93A
MNLYKELKSKHQKEVSEFPMAFAFSNQQFKEGMEKLGLTESDMDKVCSIGAGGFIRKQDSEALKDMRIRHSRELQEAIDNDQTGEGFIFDMFKYELANHEYSYTRDVESTLDALGFTAEEINANEKLRHGLAKAIQKLS